MTAEEAGRLALRKQQLSTELGEVREQLRNIDLPLPFGIVVDGVLVTITKPQYIGGVPQATTLRLEA